MKSAGSRLASLEHIFAAARLIPTLAHPHTLCDPPGYLRSSGDPHDPSSLHHYSYLAYDFNNSEAREKWVERVTNLTVSGYIDGAFVDGNRNGALSWLGGLRSTGSLARLGLTPHHTCRAVLWLLRAPTSTAC